MSRSETHNSACDYAWNLKIRSMLSKAMKKAEAEEEQKKKQQKEEEAAKVQQMRDDEAAREASAMGGDPVVTAKLRKIFGMFDEDCALPFKSCKRPTAASCVCVCAARRAGSL